ncbi:class I SAM-dependent methyltransferase [Streptomyces atratus]|uniref:class I SAM-dependent methyltransferase n=1 Tax=Streptomyces atratus TaxID=1893 RepID=UPI002254CF12|nr:class I SAM-dependent methyltransferase [Streptomyces atratus]MCX5340311.1 class I SAM-dependent methyltransferase [Streptomyces atratus]
MTGTKERQSDPGDWSGGQIAYYQARADEYDATYSIRMDMPRLEKSLDSLPIGGDVLEIACGTGQWTRLLSSRARSLTALDAAPEMLRRARDRMRGTATRFIEADVFDWEPDRQYDTVFFAFWLSHVPPVVMEPFWNLLRWALVSGGHVVFLDDSPTKAEIEDRVDEVSVPAVHRTLSDGSRHVAVKVLRDPAELTSQLNTLGWDARVEAIDPFHLAGVARPRECA